MKNPIITKNKKHLSQLMEEEITLNGSACDLNHIDVPNIIGMSGLFKISTFNDNISSMWCI